MAKFATFEDIEAWQKARELTRQVYAVTNHSLFARDSILCGQVKRAAISVMANIAEGFERNGKGEFIQFLSVAKASSGELRAHFYVAFDQGYIDQGTFVRLSNASSEIGRMVGGLIKYLRGSKKMKGAKYR